MRRARAVCASAFALVCGTAWPQQQTGVVISVPAGDRVVLRAQDQTIDVILAQVEAPRRPASLAERSRRSLRELCSGLAATLIATGTARDGSTIGKVSCAGVDAAETQVRRGLASVEPRYMHLNSILRGAQANAQSAGVGIWAHSVARR